MAKALKALRCELCNRAVNRSAVVCGKCHQNAITLLANKIRALYGQVLTEKTANAVMTIFAEAASGRRVAAH